jgi:uncharacterized membrane protein YgcG
MVRAFTDRQTDDITRVIGRAEKATGLRFSVYVGPCTGAARDFARGLHSRLGADARRAVLVFVDPDGRALEIVTGPQARELLDDRTCALAAMSMVTSFAVGDLTDGIRDGINMLAEHARNPGAAPSPV